ncbi:uncharacterized protein [Prorops nasuta]
MRSRITNYKHRDFYQLEELTMYWNASPEDSTEAEEFKKIGILLCCNSSGDEKRPLLVCEPSSTYDIVHKDAKSNLIAIDQNGEHLIYRTSLGPDNVSRLPDHLFKAWIMKFNEELIQRNRRILLLLQRDRIGIFNDANICTNISCLYFPRDFPPLLRPLKGDICRFFEMAYRKKFLAVEKEERLQWAGNDVLGALIASWEEVPQELIIASFQNTTFRTDTSLLQIDHDNWKDAEPGFSLRKYVAFDDDLSPSSSRGTTSLLPSPCCNSQQADDSSKSSGSSAMKISSLDRFAFSDEKQYFSEHSSLEKIPDSVVISTTNDHETPHEPHVETPTNEKYHENREPTEACNLYAKNLEDVISEESMSQDRRDNHRNQAVYEQVRKTLLDIVDCLSTVSDHSFDYFSSVAELYVGKLVEKVYNHNLKIKRKLSKANKQRVPPSNFSQRPITNMPTTLHFSTNEHHQTLISNLSSSTRDGDLEIMKDQVRYGKRKKGDDSPRSEKKMLEDDKQEKESIFTIKSKSSSDSPTN